MTAPADARLPGGGGYQICDVYDVVPSKFGQTTNVVSRAPTENGNQSEVYNGFDVVLNIRLARRININGGLNTGRTVTDNCGLTLTNLQFGQRQHAAYRGLLRDRAAMVGIDAGQVLRGVPAAVRFPGRDDLPESARHHRMAPTRRSPNAQVAPSLGRNLSAGPNGTVTIPLIAPSTLYEDRIQQIDFRFSRTFRVSNTRIEPQFDIYNAFNASPILAVNNTYGAAWRTPTQILAGRLFKFGMQVTF